MRVNSISFASTKQRSKTQKSHVEMGDFTTSDVNRGIKSGNIKLQPLQLELLTEFLNHGNLDWKLNQISLKNGRQASSTQVWYEGQQIAIIHNPDNARNNYSLNALDGMNVTGRFDFVNNEIVYSSSK